jgi:hypothetical protein
MYRDGTYVGDRCEGNPESYGGPDFPATQASNNHGALARCVTKADSHHLAVHRERAMQVGVYS